MSEQAQSGLDQHWWCLSCSLY